MFLSPFSLEEGALCDSLLGGADELPFIRKWKDGVTGNILKKRKDRYRLIIFKDA